MSSRSIRHDAHDETQVVIGLASRNDTATVSAIIDAAYSKYIHRIERKPKPMTVDCRDMISKHPVHILLIRDQPVGVLVLKHEEDPDHHLERRHLSRLSETGAWPPPARARIERGTRT